MGPRRALTCSLIWLFACSDGAGPAGPDFETGGDPIAIDEGPSDGPSDVDPVQTDPSTGEAGQPGQDGAGDHGLQATDAGPAVDAATDVDGGVEEPPMEPASGWAAMDQGERFAYMSQVVVPQMTEVFKKANPSAKISCATCHGSNAGQVGFKMPNTLAPLDVKAFPLDQSSNPKIAAAAKFMKEQVVPKMAELLGKPVRSPTTPDGFGCFGCHATAK